MHSASPFPVILTETPQRLDGNRRRIQAGADLDIFELLDKSFVPIWNYRPMGGELFKPIAKPPTIEARELFMLDGKHLCRSALNFPCRKGLGRPVITFPPADASHSHRSHT